jgi:hypothetical protein
VASYRVVIMFCLLYRVAPEGRGSVMVKVEPTPPDKTSRP